MERDRFSEEENPGYNSGLSQLQARYVIPFAVGVFAAILLVGLALTLKSRALLREQINLEQLTSARAGAQAISNVADGVARQVESIARTDLAAGKNFSSIQKYLKSQVEHAPLVTSLFLFNKRSRLLAATSDATDIARNLVEDICYDRIRAGDSRECFSNLYLTGDGSRRAFVTFPVFNESGAVIRVLVGGVDFDYKGIQSIVMGINPGHKGFSYLVDGAGRLVMTGDASKGGAPGNLTDGEAVQEVLSGKIGTTTSKYGRTQMLATFYPVEPLGWGFIVQRPLAEAGAGIGGLYKLLLVFLVLGTAGAAALALVQAQTITRFLFILSSRMEGVAAGKRGQRIGEEETCGLDSLSEAFNRMVTMIERSQVAGMRELEDVRETARFNQGILSSIQDLFLVTDARLTVMIASDKAEQYAAPGVSTCIGRTLSQLGESWGNERLRSAAAKAIETGEARSVGNVRFTSPDESFSGIFDFQIYPVSSGAKGALFYGREVSKSVELHEKVQSSERFFREVVSGLGDSLVVIEPEGEIEWFNPAARRFINPDNDLIGENWIELVIDDDKEKMKGLIETAGQPGVPLVMDEVVIFRGESETRVEVVVGQIKPDESESKFALTFRKVPGVRAHERKALVDLPRIKNNVRFLTIIFETMPEPLAVVDTEGSFLMVNSAFGKLFKERKELFPGRKLDSLSADAGSLIPPGSSDGKQVVKREVQVKTTRGRKFLARVKCVVVRNGAYNGSLLTFRDVEGERRARLRENRILESRVRTRMARLVSERFESVIDEMGNALKTLGGNVFAEETREVWGEAMARCKDLAHGTISLNAYSCDNPVELQTCDMDDIIKDSADYLRSGGHVPGNVTLEPSFMSGCPVLNADPDQLKLIIWHLLKNAVEAATANETDEPKVVIRAFESEMDNKKVIVVEVMDNGPDFNQANAERFFEPFLSTKSGGMGLGLTLARRAVLKHKGLADVSRSNGVTRASFYVPLDLTPEKL